MSSELTNLVKKAQSGDAQAFGDLYELYAKDMYRFAYFYTSSPFLAEDAVGDAVLAAFEKIGQLRKAESFKSWLFKILFLCCAKKQKEKSAANNTVRISEIRGLSTEPKDYVKNLELKKAMETLSKEERQIVILSFALDYTSDEISKLLGLKSGTVRSKLSRAAKKIREELRNY